jgi:hypothetical protein
VKAISKGAAYPEKPLSFSPTRTPFDQLRTRFDMLLHCALRRTQDAVPQLLRVLVITHNVSDYIGEPGS